MDPKIHKNAIKFVSQEGRASSVVFVMSLNDLMKLLQIPAVNLVKGAFPAFSESLKGEVTQHFPGAMPQERVRVRAILLKSRLRRCKGHRVNMKIVIKPSRNS